MDSSIGKSMKEILLGYQGFHSWPPSWEVEIGTVVFVVKVETP